VRTRRADTLNDVVARILLVGVLVSAAVIAIGLALLAPSGTGKRALLGQLLSEHVVYVADVPHSLRATALGVAHGRPVAVVFLGLLLLILTPILRVLGAGVYFAVAGERLYAFIAFLVLLLLMVGFVLGAVG
jgi:uncharacterized membrane protein